MSSGNYLMKHTSIIFTLQTVKSIILSE